MSVDSGTRRRMRRAVTGRYKPATGRYRSATGRYRPMTGKHLSSGDSCLAIKKRKFKFETKSGHSSNLAFYGLQPADSSANVTLALALAYIWAMLLAIVIPHLVFYFFVVLGLLLLPVAIVQKIANHTTRPNISLNRRQIS